MVGIYIIKNLKNDKCYYGSSKNIEKRWRTHLNQLNNGKYHNTHLQRSWVKHGEGNFIFEVIEECDEKILLEREQTYLDLKPDYNIGLQSSGGDNLSKNPNKKDIVRRMTESVKKRYELMTDEEKKEKYSQPMERNPNWKGGVSVKYCDCGTKIAPINNTCIKCRGKSGENNPFYGKKHTEETKEKIRVSRLGKKPSNIRPVTIDNILYDSLSEASRQLDIPSPTILWRIKSKNKKYLNYNYI